MLRFVRTALLHHGWLAVSGAVALAACAVAERAQGANDDVDGARRVGSSSFSEGWRTLQAGGPAPIRSVTRRSDGLLIGPRSSGHEIEIWVSADEGATWKRNGSIASSSAVDFGDPVVLAIPGMRTIFSAFRELSDGQFRVTVCRSDDDGDHWFYDSTVIGPSHRFVGAPFLFQRQNGDLQVYYDSEVLAEQSGYPGHQWIAMQGRSGLSGDWYAYGVVAVSPEQGPGRLTRDGMATVVQLGDDRLMAVMESVEPLPTGGAHANVVRAIESWDGGRTWDASLLRTVHEARVDPDSGRRYNAYAPYAARIGNGPVGVAFCTDEDFAGPPDLSYANVEQRRSHIKYVSTTHDFESWSSVSPLWTGSPRNYAPGLFERASNDVIATIDRLDGNQRLMR